VITEVLEAGAEFMQIVRGHRAEPAGCVLVKSPAEILGARQPLASGVRVDAREVVRGNVSDHNVGHVRIRIAFGRSLRTEALQQLGEALGATLCEPSFSWSSAVGEGPFVSLRASRASV
jgi:hypothetical protein